MDSKVAEWCFKVGFFTIVTVFALGGLIDVGLWKTERPTISHWLTQNMAWFYYPALVMLAFIGVMYVHLKAMMD